MKALSSIKLNISSRKAKLKEHIGKDVIKNRRWLTLAVNAVHVC